MSDKQYIKSPLSDVRVPPQNIEAEKALLGSILIKSEAIHEIADLIDPSAFYVERHVLIYKAMRELASRGKPIDAISLSNKLREKEQLEKCGGASFLTELTQVVPSAANSQHYAEVVLKKFICRNLITAAERISEIGYEEEDEIEELIDKAEKLLFEVTTHDRTSKVTEIGDELEGAFERLEKLQSTGSDLRGIPTGFSSLDGKLSGLQPSDLVILAARPSMGKTSLALDIARQTALKHDTGVCIFSLEMSSQQLVDRMLAAESRVDSWKLRTGKVRSDEDFSKLRDALGRLSDASIYIDDEPGATILKMRSTARKLKREGKLDLIIVDYLQLMLPSGRAKNSDSLVFQVTEISRSLKILAREMNVPVLALSQLSRAVEQRGGKPRLSDLRDSGSIEQDADVVMFIHREDRYNDETDTPNIAEIMIEKHRNGPIGRVELYFDERRTSFMDIESDDFDAFNPETAAQEF